MTPTSLLDTWGYAYTMVGMFFASLLFFQGITNPQLAKDFTQLEAVFVFLVVLLVWPGVVAVMLDDNGRWKG